MKNDTKTDRNRKSKQRDFDAMDWVRDELGGTLPPELHHMMCYLALRSNGNHECWPKQETIASDVGLKSRQTVAKRLNQLEDLGLISRKIRPNASTLITLNVGVKLGCEPELTSGCEAALTSGCESQINLKETVEGDSKEGVHFTDKSAEEPPGDLQGTSGEKESYPEKEKKAAKSVAEINCTNAKSGAQRKQFREKLSREIKDADADLTVGQAERLLVENWTAFRSYSEDQMNFWKSPATPQAGYALKTVGCVVPFCQYVTATFSPEPKPKTALKPSPGLLPDKPTPNLELLEIFDEEAA